MMLKSKIMGYGFIMVENSSVSLQVEILETIQRTTPCPPNSVFIIPRSANR